MTIKGKFITLEGGEGVGKTTNLKFIENYLSLHGVQVLVTREPGGTRLAEKIRNLLLHQKEEPITHQAELLLMFAARSQHIKQVIEPALHDGVWVLCDRFTDATYAYQGGGRNMSAHAIQWLEQFVQGSLRPDLTFLLDAPVEIGLQRAKHRGTLDRIESETLTFFEQVRRAYLLQAKMEPERIKVIKTDQPLVDVQNELMRWLIPLVGNEHHG
ncbi:MAG: dTMP kinase [Methylomicrobium sp.]